MAIARKRLLTFELSGRLLQDARPGPGGMPLALRLSEGLGLAAECKVLFLGSTPVGEEISASGVCQSFKFSAAEYS